ncbi:MAG TPA: hypothetical protein VMJ11_14970, partial [Paraburkholderia sp.]|uniref:hypothetical protein n=1 Tax=Paraburkholderia sp. TaxID=1926495 RepID=UPI002B80D04A
MEDTFRCKTQLQIYPSKRVNLTQPYARPLQRPISHVRIRRRNDADFKSIQNKTSGLTTELETAGRLQI